MVTKLSIFISSCAFFGSVFLFSSCNNTNSTSQKVNEELNSTVKEVVKFKEIQGFSLENFKIDSSSVKNGQSFSEILQNLNVSYEHIYTLGNDFKEVYDIRKIYPGDKYYTIFKNDSNKFSNLINSQIYLEKY